MFKQFKRAALIVPAASMGAVMSAHAALPAGVEEALESIGTDGAALAGIVLIAVVTVFAIKFLRKGL